MMINSGVSQRLRSAVFALLLFSSFFSITFAQLGEVAGPLGFTVQVGHTETLQWRLLNNGNDSIAVHVTIPPQLQITSNVVQAENQTTPTISLYPVNATVPSHGILTINVTVFMPLNNTPNQTSWEGILSAEEVSNQTNPGGAVVFAGVAKISSISAIPSTTTSSTTTSTVAPTAILQSSSNIIPIAIGVIVVLAIVAYAATRKKKPMSKAQARREKMLAARNAIRDKKARAGADREAQKLRAERDKLRKQLQALKKSKAKPRKTTKRARRRNR